MVPLPLHSMSSSPELGVGTGLSPPLMPCPTPGTLNSWFFQQDTARCHDTTAWEVGTVVFPAAPRTSSLPTFTKQPLAWRAPALALPSDAALTTTRTQTAAQTVSSQSSPLTAGSCCLLDVGSAHFQAAHTHRARPRRGAWSCLFPSPTSVKTPPGPARAAATALSLLCPHIQPVTGCCVPAFNPLTSPPLHKRPHNGRTSLLFTGVPRPRAVLLHVC